MKFIAALQFLTTLPMPSNRDLDEDTVAGCATYFPVVGLLLGLILAGLSWLLSLVLPHALAAALLIASLALLTGALHLDGFLDTCDGLAGHRTVEERWRIMHDSRAGGIGVVGVAILLLVKYASLSSVPANLMMATLVLMTVASRWSMVYSMFAYPYARPAGLGKAFKEKTTWPRFLAATLITLAVAAALFPFLRFSGVAVVIGVWLMALAANGYFRSKLSGLTGDTYGAVNELAEITVLVLITILARLGLS